MVEIYRKSLFDIPEDIVYLDGNSLGPLLKGVGEESHRVISKEWGKKLIKGWNESRWMDQPVRVGNKIAELLNAEKDSIVLGETLAVKLYQALSAAIDLRKDRNIILTDSGNFPSDLYIAQGLIDNQSRDLKLKVVDAEDIKSSIDDTVAVVMLTQVDYRTGRMHDLNSITSLCHRSGAIMLWDLAHSAGAVPVYLTKSRCEFAVGCTYKYLNGGPGSPGFIYVRPDLIRNCSTRIRGWLGHKSPFDFSREFEQADTIDVMRVGTPPVIQMSILEKALDIWEDVSMEQVRDKYIELSEFFISQVEKRCPDLELASPRDPFLRGSQVSFAFKEGYAVIQALIDQGIIGDFRAPNIMRFGITPLYISQEDILTAVKCLEKILKEGLWNSERFLKRKLVT